LSLDEAQAARNDRATLCFITTRREVSVVGLTMHALRSHLAAASALAAILLQAPIAIAASPAKGLVAPASAERLLHTEAARIPYQVSWTETPLSAAPGGAPQAVMSTLTYLRRDAVQLDKRPVLFVWGGGPGGQSVEMAFRGLGPRRLGSIDGNGAQKFVDNPGSLIDAADLVFIDAAGTGFTGEVIPGGGRPYWGVNGDAAAFEVAIRGWLEAHGRARSPIYLMGESYGGFRVGKVLGRLKGVNVAGAILVSPGMNLSAVRGDLTAVSADPNWVGGIDDDQAFINNLPTMAVVAVMHHCVAGKGRTTAEIYEEARRFAQGPYASALQQGDALPQDDKVQIAERIADLIGLPAKILVDANLRLQSQAFLESLIPGRVVGRLDARVLGEPPKPQAGAPRIGAKDDPSLGMHSANVVMSPQAARYLKDEVGVRTDRPYVRVNLDVNEAWDWNSGDKSLEANIAGLNVGPELGSYLRQASQARLMLLSGYYDMAIPVLAQEGELAHIGAPRDRIVIKRYETGHEIGNDPAAAQRLTADIRDFLSAAPAPRKKGRQPTPAWPSSMRSPATRRLP
jgi:carboxypeptidase C (cathepsin A)